MADDAAPQMSREDYVAAFGEPPTNIDEIAEKIFGPDTGSPFEAVCIRSAGLPTDQSKPFTAETIQYIQQRLDNDNGRLVATVLLQRLIYFERVLQVVDPVIREMVAWQEVVAAANMLVPPDDAE